MTDRTWHRGPPPHIGWWNASSNRNPEMWRWWDSEGWSRPAPSNYSAEEAALEANASATAWWIEWTNYWPEDARVPRVAP